MKPFANFIAELTPGFTAVLDSLFGEEDYIPIDLSENNAALENINLASATEISDFITHFLKDFGKKVAFGGYNEVRALYRQSGLFNTEGKKTERRNIHLGLDFWAKAHTSVLAVLDGELHSFKDNAGYGDYGPTIILEHKHHHRKFYSLYGHLSRSSLKGLQIGAEVKAGDVIGELGTPQENGNYAPHLHFQIIEQLQEKEGDFPGVTSARELDFYLRNCPDPNLLVKIGAP